MSTLNEGKFSRLFLTLMITLVLGAALSACGSDDDDTDTPNNGEDVVLVSDDGHFQATLHTMPDPPTTGMNTVHLKLMGAKNEVITGATLTVEPFMPGHGHGTPEVPTFAEDGDGMYTISNIKYTMPGAWELRIDITSDQTQDRIVAEYDVE